MSKKLLLSGITLGLLSAIAFWQLDSNPTQSPSQTAFRSDNNAGQADSSATSNLMISSFPVTAEAEPVHTIEQLSEQVEDALLQYEELSQYPPTSQPILSEEHVHSFMNTDAPQASHPFPFSDLEQAIQLSIALNQYNYFFGDLIHAQLSVGNVPASSTLSARVVLTDLAGEVLAETSNLDISELQAKVTIDTKAYNTSDWPLEMNLGAHVDVNGYQMFISAPFRINTETAELDSVGFSEPVAENLIIPVNLNVKLPGYYFVAGILYSQNNNQPLIHLEAEGPLSEGLATLELKAHIQALKKSGDEGPYYLDKIRIERWSDEQIPRDIAGKVPEADYSVEGFPFNAYQDIPYIDPLAEERKRLMQGLTAR